MITSGCCTFSVPDEYVGKKVDVSETEHNIKVYYRDNLISSYVRPKNDTVYLPGHMPEKYSEYDSFGSENFLKWAEEIGISVLLTVKNLLSSEKDLNSKYNDCILLIKLSEEYSKRQLEKVCEKALTASNISIENINKLLKNVKNNKKR